jgi:hypothetical protein
MWYIWLILSCRKSTTGDMQYAAKRPESPEEITKNKQSYGCHLNSHLFQSIPKFNSGMEGVKEYIVKF